MDSYIAVCNGATVYFARPDVMKGTLTKTLAYAKPTVFFAVPRVWEKLEERIKENMASLSKPKVKLFQWARSVTFKYQKASLVANKTEDTTLFVGLFLWIFFAFLFIQYKIAEKLLLNKIKLALGLDKARVTASGAAPFNKNTAQFFASIGLPIIEAFGMSETTGAITTCVPDRNRIGSSGFLNKFSKIKIENPDAAGNGELCLYGRHMFMGYLNSPSKTQETYDSDGYLHTGDIAYVDQDKFVYVTGRIKELIITAGNNKHRLFLLYLSIKRTIFTFSGGENVAPIPIEDSVKHELHGIVSNSMVVGDKRKYITILITIKVIIPDFDLTGNQFLSFNNNNNKNF